MSAPPLAAKVASLIEKETLKKANIEGRNSIDFYLFNRQSAARRKRLRCASDSILRNSVVRFSLVLRFAAENLTPLRGIGRYGPEAET